MLCVFHYGAKKWPIKQSQSNLRDFFINQFTHGLNNVIFFILSILILCDTGYLLLRLTFPTLLCYCKPSSPKEKSQYNQSFYIKGGLQ